LEQFRIHFIEKIKKQGELITKLKNLDSKYIGQLTFEYDKLENMIETYAEILFDIEGADKINSHFSKTFFGDDFEEQIRQIITYENS